MYWNGGSISQNCTFFEYESNSIVFMAYISWFVDQIVGQKILSLRVHASSTELEGLIKYMPNLYISILNADRYVIFPRR
jgi:restriction endonuclease S subunit